MTEATLTATRPDTTSQGFPIWYELMTTDPAAADRFYRATLGWDIPAKGIQNPIGQSCKAFEPGAVRRWRDDLDCRGAAAHR